MNIMRTVWTALIFTVTMVTVLGYPDTVEDCLAAHSRTVQRVFAQTGKRPFL